MGDRANVVVREGKEEVWLYTHWGGTDLPADVRAALAKQWRWNDAPYLARIIFDEMTRGNAGEETGFGIWSGPCDNEHDIIVVDVSKQEVQFWSADAKTARPKKLKSAVAFTDYAGRAAVL